MRLFAPVDLELKIDRSGRTKSTGTKKADKAPVIPMTIKIHFAEPR
jgi:hypothetical protein